MTKEILVESGNSRFDSRGKHGKSKSCNNVRVDKEKRKTQTLEVNAKSHSTFSGMN